MEFLAAPSPRTIPPHSSSPLARSLPLSRSRSLPLSLAPWGPLACSLSHPSSISLAPAPSRAPGKDCAWPAVCATRARCLTPPRRRRHIVLEPSCALALRKEPRRPLLISGYRPAQRRPVPPPLIANCVVNTICSRSRISWSSLNFWNPVESHLGNAHMILDCFTPCPFSYWKSNRDFKTF